MGSMYRGHFKACLQKEEHGFAGLWETKVRRESHPKHADASKQAQGHRHNLHLPLTRLLCWPRSSPCIMHSCHTQPMKGCLLAQSLAAQANPDCTLRGQHQIMVLLSCAGKQGIWLDLTEALLNLAANYAHLCTRLHSR